MLRSYLLDTYTARKLGQRSTGNAARSAGEPPSVSPTNFYLAPGIHTRRDYCVSAVRSLRYVAHWFWRESGHGDYSRGAAGLWIENGALAYPVEEITIAGSPSDAGNIEMIGNEISTCAKSAK